MRKLSPSSLKTGRTKRKRKMPLSLFLTHGASDAIQRQLLENSAALTPLLRPLESISPRERACIGAESSAAALAHAWEVNARSLRLLLPRFPPATLCLPAPPTTIGWSSDGCGAGCSSSGDGASASGYDNADQLLAHLARDWSSWGAEARRRTHRPVLRALRAYVRSHRRESRATRTSASSNTEGAPGRLRVLVPGAGGCRLAWEVARLGHHVEASDSSDAMVLAAHSILTSGAIIYIFQ